MRRPYVVWSETWDPSVSNIPRTLEVVKVRALRLYLRHAVGVWVPADDARAYCVDRGAQRHRVARVPTTWCETYLKSLHPPSPCHRSGKPSIGFVGRRSTAKGFQHFLGIAESLLKDGVVASVVVVGDAAETDLETELQRLSEVWPQKIAIEGYAKSTQALANAYGAVDILVLPSLQDTWGLTVVEGISSGCFVVASDRIGAARALLGAPCAVGLAVSVEALEMTVRRVVADDVWRGAHPGTSLSYESHEAEIRHALAMALTCG